MIVVPSPEMLLHHKSPAFNNQITTVEIFSNRCLDSNSPRQFPKLSLDLFFAWSKNRKENPVLCKSNIISILSAFLSYGNVRQFLYFGILALNIGEVEAAIEFLTEAAKLKSKEATNLIGIIYSTHKANSDLPLRWYQRALRIRSNQALSLIGEYHLHASNYQKSLKYLARHYFQTKSILTATTIATALQHLSHNLNGNNKQSIHQLLLKWLRFCASQGMLSAVNKIIVELNGKPEDIKLFFQWLSIGTRYNILKSQQYNFSPLLKANFSNDFSYPPLSSVKAHVQQFAPFNSMPRTVTFPVKYVTTTPIQTAKPPPKENKNKIPITLFPSNSPTSRVIQLFRYATSDYSQRNLQCCTLVLNQIRSSAPQTLFDCEIWRNKFFAVDDSESQVSCGFICYLLKDYNQAFICFRNAAELGSEVGCCMCGLMLFHENSSKREIKNGLYFFSRCKLDPIALIHMGVACNEKEWVKRATELTKMKYKSGEIYEYVGDLFFEGIKFPKEMRIAQMWYGYAIAKYEEYGFGIEKVSKKLASAVFLQESHS